MTHSPAHSKKPWLKNYMNHVPEHKQYEEKCLPEFLEDSARRFPDKAALIYQGKILTYSQLVETVDRFAHSLQKLGVKKGDSVAIILPNLISCVVSYYAIMKIGAIAVMNNPLYSDRELAYQLDDSDSKVLITLDLLANRMIDLRDKTKVKTIITTSIGDYLPFPKTLLFKLFGRRKKLSAQVKPAPDVYEYKALLKNAPTTPMLQSAIFEAPAMYQYTGGTTGVTKGVVLTHKNLSIQAQQILAWFPEATSDEIILGALPFFHVFGLSASMNIGIYAGWTNVLVPKPQPDQLLEAITAFKPTFAPLVPTMFIGLINHPMIDKADLRSIKSCFSGSASIPVEVIEEFERRTGSIIVEGYGLTETSPVTHINPSSIEKRKIGSIGLPISDTLARIVDLKDSNIDVPPGEIGELMIKGPQVMETYHNRPDETRLALEAGWMKTGDIARMDDQGYFFIVDRKKDLIISSGYNVYPRDIEEVFFEHPSIKEACVIGIPHHKRGEAVKVYIVLKKGKVETEAALLEFCKDKLAKYKWPLKIEFRQNLPKSNVGKILKKELRKEQSDN